LQAEIVVKVPIRRIPIVLDLTDPLAPGLSLQDFKEVFSRDPDPQRYRVVNVEVITSPDDQQPMLVTECGRYTTFLRREGDSVYFRKRLG